jgi:membrane protein YqaA with SNARE-associated domain
VDGGPAPPAPPAADARAAQGELARQLTQVALSLVALVAAIALAARFARGELDLIGRGFVARFGLLGMFAGVFLADALSFPVPPQFYMLAAITGGGSQAAAMAVICAASLLAGHTGYHLAESIARVRLLAARIDVFRPKVDRLFARHGAWAIAVGGLTPIPFSVLCYLSGLYRIPRRYFAALLLLRVPRLLVFYALIRLGWSPGG